MSYLDTSRVVQDEAADGKQPARLWVRPTRVRGGCRNDRGQARIRILQPGICGDGDDVGSSAGTTDVGESRGLLF